VWLTERIELVYVPAAASHYARRPKGRHVLAFYGAVAGDRDTVGWFRSWQENYYLDGKNHTRMHRESWVMGEADAPIGRTFNQWKQDLLSHELTVKVGK
jgi:hypothetical protein